jgi:hypothetical protein
MKLGKLFPLATTVTLLALLAPVLGCQEDTPGEKISDAAEDVKDAAKDAADDVKDAAADLADGAKDAARDLTPKN